MSYKSHSSYKKIIVVLGAIALAVLLFSQTAIGKRVNLPAGIIEAVKTFFAGNPDLHGCDYKDGTILLIKPIKTGVGDGAYEAGDIVEIRDGTALCERFGNGDPLGKDEKTKLLPVYYPAKLTDKQKRDLTTEEYATSTETMPDGKIREMQVMKKRRSEGMDYTKFLSGAEVLKVKSFEKLDRLPEIDLTPVIQKSPEQKSVVQISSSLAGIENARNSINKVIRKIIPFAYAGTGGTKTICTSGCDYTTLSGWEAGEEGILTQPAIAQITGGFTDTTAVTIAGWTTTEANYIKIYTTAAARHSGKWDESKYHLEFNLSTTNVNAITVQQSYTWIDGIQIAMNLSGSTYIYCHGIDLQATYGKVSNSIIAFSTTSYENSSGAIGVYVVNTNSGKIWNTIVYDTNASSYAKGLYSNYGGASVYNSTVHGLGNGYLDYYGGYIKVVNSLAQGNADGFTGTFVTGSDYNASDIASDAPGANSNNGATFTFVDLANHDFHLASNDAGAKDRGTTDPGAGLFSDDIDGETRPPAGGGTYGLKWDIGADQTKSHITGVNKPQTNFMKDSSLVGYWSFDGAATNWTSATAGTATDLSGNNNTGTLTNMSRSASPAPGISGQALSFDGVDDYVNIPNSSSIQFNGQAFSVSFWMKTNSVSLETRRIISKDNLNFGNQFPWDIQNYGSQIFFEIRDNSSIQTVSTIGGSISADKFYHVVATFNPTSYMKLYLNGVLNGTPLDVSSYTFSGTSDTNPLRIGTLSYTLAQYFPGLIDEVRVYNRALSASEISDLYRAGAAKLKVSAPITNSLTSGLVGSWTFNGQDMSGNTAIDRSPAGGNNGTLTGGPTPAIGKVGQALSFNGSSDYISISDNASLNIAGSMTVSLWVKTSSSATGGIIGEYNDHGYWNYRMYMKSGALPEFNIGNDNIFSTAASSTTALNDGKFHHLVGVYNLQNLKLYVDGVQKDSVAENRTPGTGYAFVPTCIGTARYNCVDSTYDSYGYFNGLIDEVRVYNRALSASEVADLYNLGLRKVKFKQ